MGIDHYENFPVASWLVPRHLRAPIREIYRFARCADDIADEGEAAPVIESAASQEPESVHEETAAEENAGR